MDLSHIHIGDLFSAGTLLVALAIYRKMNIIVYQHKLMWAAFADERGLSKKANGASAGDV